jgi:hypothetical protein
VGDGVCGVLVRVLIVAIGVDQRRVR